MAFPQSPSADARNRYSQAFQSRIFAAPQDESKGRFVPAGKRRDQTTSELFGVYEDKELHAMPKTFSPKDDPHSAKQKKLNFLSSEVLPANRYPPNPQPRMPAAPNKMQECFVDAESDEYVHPKMKRQQEHTSELFGRETPAVTEEQLRDPKARLTPTDFKWFSIPEPAQSGHGLPQEVSHKDRHYHEKCSNLFEHVSPHAREYAVQDAEKQMKVEEAEGDAKRRANVYYSDLFGRNTPMDLPQQEPTPDQFQYHPKQRGPTEDKIIVHQDWTDSRTELMHKRNKLDHVSAFERKSHELHQARIFDQEPGYALPSTRDPGFEPVTTDNSGKVKNTFGQHTQQIHQAHLRTSLTEPAFYDDAGTTTHWEVVELHISGLNAHADANQVRDLCAGFDLQIVKVAVDMDPVRNLCKGRAKIMVRYNPHRDSIHGLVQKLEEERFRVEL